MTSYSCEFHFLSVQILFSVCLLGVFRSSECTCSVFPLLHKHTELCIRELKQTLQSVGGKEERGGGGKKQGWKMEGEWSGVERSQCWRKETDWGEGKWIRSNLICQVQYIRKGKSLPIICCRLQINLLCLTPSSLTWPVVRSLILAFSPD